jgi:hypothetical protein
LAVATDEDGRMRSLDREGIDLVVRHSIVSPGEGDRLTFE